MSIFQEVKEINKPMFTVAVERKAPDEQFTAEDIKLFHQECGGGAITISMDISHWRLHCIRCHTKTSVPVSKDGTALLMKTAIDGGSRKIPKYYENDDDIQTIPRT
jgi:hypothetical protein